MAGKQTQGTRAQRTRRAVFLTLLLALLAGALATSASGLPLQPGASKPPKSQIDPAAMLETNAGERLLAGAANPPTPPSTLTQPAVSPALPGQTAEPESDYAGLSDSEAIAAIRATHPTLLDQPLWSPPELSPGQQIAGWLDDSTARVEGPEGFDGRIFSATPIRSALGSGTPELVDVGLERGGEGYRPENPLTPYVLPAQASGSFAFAESGITVGFPDAAAVALEPAGEKLAAPNAWTDTDLLISPLPEGFATQQVLRSAESPEHFSVSLDLPAGAELLAAGTELGLDSAAVRLPGTDDYLAITPPFAWDAEGERIETSLRITGPETIEVSIDHREAGVAYPAVLDPTYAYQGQESWSGWSPNPATNYHFQMLRGGTLSTAFPGGGYGLWIIASRGHLAPAEYGVGWSASWSFLGAYGTNQRPYYYRTFGVGANARNSMNLFGLMDASTLRPIFGTTRQFGQSPPRSGDPWISPWGGELAGVPYHFEYDVRHCFTGYDGLGCEPASFGSDNPDLADRVPFMTLLIKGQDATPEPPFTFMRGAYVYTYAQPSPPTVPPVNPPPVNRPVNTSPPTISGTARAGEILTANKGTWTGTEPIAYDYQWRRCDASGNNCTDVAGERADRHILLPTDVGRTIRVRVTATNAAGSAQASSAQTAQVQPAPPVADPPETTITQSPSRTTGTFPVTFKFSSSQAGSSFECAIDGAAFTPCSSPNTYSDLADGLHLFLVRAVNQRGEVDPTPASHSWRVDKPRPGQVEELARQANAAATEPSEIADTDDGSSLEPTVEREVGESVYEASDAIAGTTISADPAGPLVLPTDSGGLEITPQGVSVTAHEGSYGAGGDSVVFPETAPGAHTIARPQPDGLESFAVLENAAAPTAYSWALALPGDEELRTTPVGAVEVVDPDSDPNEEVAVAEIHPPVALDAQGSTVPATLTVSGDTATMTIDPLNAVFPVVASPWFSALDVYTEEVCCVGGGQTYLRKRSKRKPFHKRHVIFGYNDDFYPVNADAHFDEAEGGGAMAVRIGARWCDAQPAQPAAPTDDPADYEWSVLKALLDGIVARHRPNDEFRALIVPSSAPYWASEDALNPNFSPTPHPDIPGAFDLCAPESEKDASAVPPAPEIADGGAALEAWRNYVTALTRYLAGENPDGRDYLAEHVAAIEIWNEPNLDSYWGGRNPNVADYIDVYSRAAGAIRTAAGEDRVQVLSGGLSSAGKDDPNIELEPFLRDFSEQLPSTKRPDGIGLHFYANNKRDPRLAANNIEAQYAAATEAMKDGDFSGLEAREMPRWLTEFGFPSRNVNGGEEAGENDPRPGGLQREVLVKILNQLSLYPRTPTAGEQPRPRALILHRLVDPFEQGVPYDPEAEDPVGDEPDLNDPERRLFGTLRPRTSGGEYPWKPAYCALARKVQKESDCLPQEDPPPPEPTRGTGISSPAIGSGSGSFEGRCSLAGSADFEVEEVGYGLNQVEQWTLDVEALGACVERDAPLAGSEAEGSPALLSMGAYYECASLRANLEDGSEGTGTLALTYDSTTPDDDVVVPLTYKVIDSGVDGHQLRLVGDHGGQAIGTLDLEEGAWGGCDAVDTGFETELETAGAMSGDG